jgi:hypothetical protein
MGQEKRTSMLKRQPYPLSLPLPASPLALSRYLIFALPLVLCGLNLWLYSKKKRSSLK